MKVKMNGFKILYKQSDESQSGRKKKCITEGEKEGNIENK